MGVLLRVLGLHALAALADTMPARTARVLTFVMLVAANLFPLFALLVGAWQAGDVLLTYWLENIAIGLWQLVKIITAQGTDPAAGARGNPLPLSGLGATIFAAGFFSFHYGIFTVVHGLFVHILARESGTSGSTRGFTVVFLVLFLSHGFSTVVHWFGRGERRDHGPRWTMHQPYGRIIVLQAALLGGFFLLTGLAAANGSPGAPSVGTYPGSAASSSVLPGVLLIVLKIALDGGLHLRAHRETVRAEQGQLTRTR